MLPINLIYFTLNLIDPNLFEKEMVTNNLFKLNEGYHESDLYRQTGKTTRLIIEVISLISSGEKTALVVCRDYQHVAFFTRQIQEKLLLLERQFNNLEFILKRNEIIFKKINSKIIIRSDLDMLWSDLDHNSCYRDN